MYHRCVPVAINALARSHHLVDRALCLNDPALLTCAIADGVFPFDLQIKTACAMAKRLCFPVAHLPVPEAPDTTDLLQIIEATRDAISTLTEADFAGADTRDISHRAGFADLTQTASEYVDSFAIPNLWFHVSMAYASLRVAGVDVGKADFDGLHGYPDGFSWI